MRNHCLPPLRAVLIACIALLGATGADAQIIPDSARADSTLIRLRALEARAVTPVVTAGGTSAIEVAVSSLRLAPAPTVEELLRAVPMLHVRRNSRGEAELVARGSESRQVAVLVDGVPLTLGWDARADLSMLPATAAQEIRVLRGLSTMLHGPNVLGGVVEMSVIGEHTPAGRALHAAMGVDHTGGYGMSAGASLPWNTEAGEVLLRSGGGWRDTPGVPLARGVREPFAGERSLRLNTDESQANAFLGARYRSDAGPWISALASGFRAQRGIAAELGIEDARFWRYPHVSRALATLTGGTGFHDSPFGGSGDVEFSLGLDHGRTDIVSYATRAYDDSTSFENGDDRTLTVRLLADQSVGARGDLSMALTYADILHHEMVPEGTFTYQQRLYSAGFETSWRVTEQLGPLRALRASFGGAYDGGSTPQTGDKPHVPSITDWGGRAGMSAMTASGRTQLHAGISRRGRFPALREAFSGALDRFEPNPALSPERLTALEAGVTTHAGGMQLQVVGFHHRLDDAFVRISRDDGKFQRVNENEMRSTGVELLASRSFGDVSVGGDLTWQSASLVTPTLRIGRLENQPELAGGMRVDLSLFLGARAHAAARYTGDQYCLAPSGDDVQLRAGTRFSGDISRQFRLRRGSRIEARLGVDNITDTALYDQCGLPQPGRLLSLQLRLF